VLATIADWLSQFTQLQVAEAGLLLTATSVPITVWTARKADKRWRHDKRDRQKANARLVTVVNDWGTGTEPISEMVIMNDGPETILTAAIADVQPRPEGTSVAGHFQLGFGDRPTVGVIKPGDKAEFFVHCLDSGGNRVPWPAGRRRVTIE
jgi:hypothetical protein